MADKNSYVIDGLIVNNHALLNKTPDGEVVYGPPFTVLIDMINLQKKVKIEIKLQVDKFCLIHHIQNL